MDERIACCINCRYSSGNKNNLYCYRLGSSVDEYAACLMYEDRFKGKEENYAENSRNKQ